MYEDEIWKQIEDLPYEVSNYGRFKSHVCDRDHKTKIIKGAISKNGYIVVSICGKRVYLHRLVAYYFVEGYRDGLFVNHKDLNKTNNHWTNLEWVTNRENVIHAWANNAYDCSKLGWKYSEEQKDQKRESSPLRKQVLNTSTGEIYRSVRELAEKLGSDCSGLSKQIRKNRPHKGILYTYI